MRVKGSPGDFVPFDVVVSKLSDVAYGASELVELGLFYSDHFVRDAVECGKLAAKKINKHSLVICRQDILNYWSTYRKEDVQVANNVMLLRFTIDEVDTISSLVKYGKENHHKDFTKDDLVRNVINYIKRNKISYDKNPHLFQKNP